MEDFTWEPQQLSEGTWWLPRTRSLDSLVGLLVQSTDIL